MRPEGCPRPAGVSPVRVGIGAPGSRPRFVVETRRAERGVKSLFGGSKIAGRSAEGREFCSLVTVITGEPSRSCHGEGHVQLAQTGLSVGFLRGRGSGTRSRSGNGTGETRLRRLVSKDRSYKPKVKTNGAQRESDGVEVLAPGEGLSKGKGPDGGHAKGGGKREGMTGTTRSKHPRGHEPVDKVRQLQRRLYVAAKRSPERRFHALYDRVFRGDILEAAWKRVRSNRGAAGVDRITLANVEEYGEERMLQDLQDALRAGTYHPSPVRRLGIPKPDGGVRPLGIPTVRDRVAQQAAKLVLEPVFEADFSDSSYGYRPKRSATQVLERIRKAYIAGNAWVLELDIRSYFDSIDHERLM